MQKYITPWELYTAHINDYEIVTNKGTYTVREFSKPEELPYDTTP